MRNIEKTNTKKTTSHVSKTKLARRSTFVLKKNLEDRLNSFLEENNLELISELSHGYSSIVYLVYSKKENKKLIVKIEKETSSRVNMIEKESLFLNLINKSNIAPKFYIADKENRAILMEYIDGQILAKKIKEIDSSNISQKEKKDKLILIIKNLFKKANQIDDLDINHRQLMGELKNIIVKENLDTEIIDYEKAILKERSKNYSQIKNVLFNNNSKYKKIIEKYLTFEDLNLE